MLIDNGDEYERCEDETDEWYDQYEDCGPNGSHGYVIACEGKQNGKTVYLQDKRKGGYWTEYISNARVFDSRKEVNSLLGHLNFNHPRIIQI